MASPSSAVKESAEPPPTQRPILPAAAALLAQGKVPTLLDVVQWCHNHDPWSDDAYVPFHLGRTGAQIGFLPPSVVEAVVESEAEERHGEKDGGRSRGGAAKVFGIERDGDAKVNKVWILDELDTPHKRTEAMRRVVEAWRDADRFPDPLQGWRNELYAVYGPDANLRDEATGRRIPNPPAFSLERSACALFGLVTYGVHATAYVRKSWDREGSGAQTLSSAPRSADGLDMDLADDYLIWVPRRSATKSTWPNYLDNSVAGGITSGDEPFESMVRECAEEAGLDEELVRRVTKVRIRRIVSGAFKQTGVISYIYTTPSGLVQPEVEYCYDIALPSTSHRLRPTDGEAQSFSLVALADVLASLRSGEFKPNTSLVLVDFLLRHGIVTYESCDCNYLELCSRLHHALRLPTC